MTQLTETICIINQFLYCLRFRPDFRRDARLHFLLVNISEEQKDFLYINNKQAMFIL